MPMRTYLRSNSFSGMLAGGSSFYFSVICFLFVLLVVNVQHGVRLSNQVERLHWQLALAQLARSAAATERPQSADATAAQLESLVLAKDAEERLQEFQNYFKKLYENTQHPGMLNQPTCPEMTSDETEEKDSVMMGCLRVLVGLLLVLMVVACVVAWGNLDRAASLLPQPIVQKCLNSENRKPISQVLAYKVDLWFSTHKHAKVLALFGLTLLLVGVGSLALFSVGKVSLYDALWSSLAGVGIEWKFSEEIVTSAGVLSIVGRLVSVMISLGGLLVTALLLGIVSESLSEKVDDMKKGASDVLESDHTLILGWSDEMMPIIRQICLANESIGGSAIVILAEREKHEMETEIMRNEIPLRGSRIICRSGNPLLKQDLDKVSVHSARSIIVLANQQSPDQSDARVLRIILSLKAFHETGGLKVGYIVAELCDVDNEPLVKLVGGDLVQTVVSHDIIGRLMIQCALQPGLAAVYDALMGFAGCEFYLQKWPELTGRTFNEALLSFPEAVPLGVKQASTGEIKLNTEDDYTLQDGDELVVIAEDEDTYKPEETAQIKAGLCPTQLEALQGNKILFLGWRRDMDDMITVLDSLVDKGTELWLYNEVPIEQRDRLLIEGGLDPENLENIVLRYREECLVGDLITRKKLEKLRPATFSSILVLADEAANGDDIADADSRNLATLLLLRDIMRETGKAECTFERSNSGLLLRALSKDDSYTVIVSEILDARTRNLIMQLNISEFVMSNEIVSMTLAMVAESADVNRILQELFSENGCELYIRPAENYIHFGETLSFFQLLGRSRERNEIVIGYQTKRGGNTIINPSEKNKQMLTLDEVVSVIVLAH